MAVDRDLSKIPMSMFLSGVESDTYWDIVVRQGQIKTVLMSYHYFQKKPKNTLKDRIEKHPDVKVFIDSGAFTFFSKGQDKDLDFWESYIEQYLAWARDNKDCIFAIANLDIEALVGYEKVQEWNKKYFEPFEKETGVLVCYIWHGMTGEKVWEDYCRKYKYIGFSSDESTQITLQRRMKLVNTAKKHGTIIHGMALTETQMLVRVPLFSCDSTTWIVGQQYGELNWFDGRKMRRLSKNEWRRNYKTQLLKEPFNANWDKLINGMGGRGDTYELLRLNVLAYKLAEEHIRKRLGKKQYWLKGGNSKAKEVKSLEDINLPDYEWFTEGNQEDYKEYLEGLGIPLDIDKDEAIDILYNFYLYVSEDDERIDEIPDQDLMDYAKEVVGASVESREEAIESIKEYYRQNATGERTDFKDDLVEEGAPARAQERKVYIEDEEFEVIDLSANDIENHLSLPAPKDHMPEVTEYDEELSKRGVLAVRDSQGKFIKGQKKIRKPKNIYSDKYPKLHCSTCYKSGDCPEYKDGYVCAYDKMFKKFDSRDVEDIMDAMNSMVNMNLGRLQKAMMFETMDGGMPTGEVTGLIDQNMKLLEKMKEMNSANPKTILQQRRVVSSDGTETIDTSLAVNPQQGGILSAIFGSKSRDKDENDEKVVEADYKVVD